MNEVQVGGLKQFREPAHRARSVTCSMCRTTRPRTQGAREAIEKDKQKLAGESRRGVKQTSPSSSSSLGHQLQTVAAMSGEKLIDLLNAASTLEDECNKVLVVRDEDMITKNVTQTDKFCCGSIVVFLEAGSFSGKGSYSQAPLSGHVFFLAVPRGRLAVATRWGILKAMRLRMPGVRSAALQHGSTSGSAPTGIGEKQAWKDVLVGREVLRGPVAEGDRAGRNADEECTGCPGNDTGTEVSHCGCSGKDEGIG